MILDGEIYRGCGRGAAEIGHLRIHTVTPFAEPDIVPLEQAASGWAIGALAPRHRGFDAGTSLFRLVLGDPSRISALEVGQAFAPGGSVRGT